MSSGEPTRRSVLSRIWVGLGVLALFEGVWIVSDFVRPRKRRERDDGGDGVIVAGPVERFDPGSVTAFPEGRFYLARLEDGGFLALYRKCTHLGCTVPWSETEGRFVCPCHASVFDITGEVLSPPAPRPLDLFAVRIENGIVKVDTSKVSRRSQFSNDQAVRS